MPRALLINVFTSETRRQGNPAAVVFLGTQKRDDQWMQDTAFELDRSETAFLTGPDENGSWGIAYYSPYAHVLYCGHATMAAARALGHDADFITASGMRIHCTVNANSVTLDAPTDTLTHFPPQHDISHRVAKAFGLAYSDIVDVLLGHEDLLVRVTDPAALKRATPDADLVSALSTRGVILTTKDPESSSAIFARCFYPLLGLLEDFGTGSAARSLGAFWLPILRVPVIRVTQLSTRPCEYTLSAPEPGIIRVTTLATVILDGELAD